MSCRSVRPVRALIGSLIMAIDLIVVPCATADVLYVSTSDSGVVTVTPDGKVTNFAKPPGLLWGVAFDRSGNLFVGHDAAGEVSGGISRISPGGLVTPFFSGDPVHDLVFDSSGNLYASSTGVIRRFTPDGTATIIAKGSFGGGLALDRHGDLFAADREARSVVAIGPNGTTTTFAKLPYAQIIGLAFDSSDNLYVSSPNGPVKSIISKITPDGTIGTFAGKGLDDPFGLAFDSSGNLYVADVNDISRITPSGVVSTVAAFPKTAPDFIAIQVPEPATLALLALSAVAVLRRRGPAALIVWTTNRR